MIKSQTSTVKCLHCPSCADDLEESMMSVDGVEDIKINYATGKMTVAYDPEKLTYPEIQAILDRQGCQILEKEMEEEERVFSFKNREFLLALASGLGLFPGIFIMFATPDPVILQLGYELHISGLFFTAAMVFGGYYVAKRAAIGLLNKRFVIDSLMIIGALGAVAIDAFAEGAAVLFLFSIAELLEDYSVERSRNSLKELVDLSPKMVRVKVGRLYALLPVESVNIKDVIKVKPGESIGIDGTIIKGSSSINQAPVTGESLPVQRTVGESVFAGTMNGEGLLLISAEKSARDSTLAKIISMVEAAEEQKSGTERFIDRFSKYYTPSVVLMAVLVTSVPTFVFNQPFEVWFYKSLLLLLISCPCALALSTPIAIASSITSGARNGVLFKGGVHIESLPGINTFAFDKTGTLTEGKPGVTEIIAKNKSLERKTLMVTASLENQAAHPIARAIVDYAKEKKLEPEEVSDFTSIPGKGVKGKIRKTMYYAGSRRLFDPELIGSWDASTSRLESEGRTIVIVGTREKIIGVIGISDKIRASSRSTIEFLHRKGIKRTVMITGDNKNTAKAVADRIGISEYHAELLPEQKVEFVRKLSSGGNKVAMVGDGVNDAPAMATAELGIAMGAAGSDTALEVADIALMKDDLSKIPYLVTLGRKTMEVVKQNLVLAIGIKLAFAILVFPGLVTLWMAVAIGDMGVSLVVILNALRLSRIKP